MSVKMMENDNHQDDKQRELSCHHDIVHGDQGSHMGIKPLHPPPPPPPHHDQSKHSYFLRAKSSTPRFSGFDNEDVSNAGEFKKPSSISRVGMDHKERERERERASSSSYTSLSEEEDLAKCLVMLSNKSLAIVRDGDDDNKDDTNKVKDIVEKGTFQCKACKKVFNSHQALGGHRASHKKVKGCFASKTEDEENMDDELIQDEQLEHFSTPEPVDASRPPPSPSTRKRAKMHECSVCRRVFSSGQALGGHKRCHWLTTSTDNAFIPNFHDFQYDHRTQQLCKRPIFIKPLQHDHNHSHNNNLDHNHQLDLNLNLPPAPHHDHHKINNDGDKTSKYEASTRLCLQQWTDKNQAKTGNNVVIERKGEEGCGMKLQKLSDLRDVNLDGGWLQMGIP